MASEQEFIKNIYKRQVNEGQAIGFLGLIALCLKSRKFISRLVLASSIVIFLSVLIFLYLENCNDEMCGLLLVYGIAVSEILSIPIITGSMISISRNFKKSIFSIIFFLVISIIFILLLAIVSIYLVRPYFIEI